MDRSISNDWYPGFGTMSGAIIVPVIAGLVFIAIAAQLSERQYLLGVLAVSPFLFLSMLNFRAVLYLLPFTLMINMYVSVFAVSEWMAALVILAFLLSHRSISAVDLAIPLRRPLMMFTVILVVSIVKSANIGLSLLMVNHFLLFIGLVLVLYNTVTDLRMMYGLAAMFFIAVAGNGLSVIAEAVLDGTRAFGLAGVMYVDYVGLSLTVVLTMILLSTSRREKTGLIVFAIFLGITMVLTQTRSIWIITASVVALIVFFIMKRTELFGIDVRSLRRIIIVGSVAVVIVFAVALVLNPQSFSRLTETGIGSEADVTESGLVRNSFVSRLLIWHTGLNAFLANPVLGIGAYAFPFSAQYYYTIPELFFTLYVENLSPHQTFLAILIETGMIGFIAFTAVWFMLAAFIRRRIINGTSIQDRKLATITSAAVLYCLASMWVTDAWLWGHGIVLFALAVGILFAHERIRSAPISSSDL